MATVAKKPSMTELQQPNVGQALRALREQRGLSLRALAEKCGLSFNAISRIEHGENSPTVATLHLLAHALNVPITAFFETTYEQSIVLVRRDHRLRSLGNGISMESLGVGLRDQQLEPFLVTAEPNAGSHDSPIVHTGEEFVFCLMGKLTYQINGETYELEAGDSLLFDAMQPHCFCNKSGAPTQFLIVFQGVEGKHSVERHYLEG